MAWILFFDTDHSKTIRAAFGWQIEIDNFRKLFLQYRYENFIQRNAENGRFIGGSAGVGAVVDRFLAMGNTLDREHRECLGFIVVAGMITERAFFCLLAGINIAFEDDFCRCRYLQTADTAFDNFRFSSP